MSSLPFKVKAVYEYASPHDDDLHFPNGQIITVTEEEGDDWYVGEYVDASGVKQDGLFPKNFVEKYEPTAPPRPTRTKKKETEAPVAPAETIPPPVGKEAVKEEEPDLEQDEEVEEKSSARVPVAKEPTLPPAPKADVASPPPQSKPTESALPSAPKAAPAPKQSNPQADPVDKPSGGSFRDRIAAFNKAAAPPPAPFKPGGLGSGSNTFIKKPFVPPPPSKNAYVPPPREPVQPQKAYRREEDPEIIAKQQEDQEQAERAGLAPTSADGNEEDQPKPTSLKERIALLQKQQQEQAARHAEAAAKKEKPKRPASKKRTESHNTVEDGEGAILEKTKTEDTIGAHSVEAIEEEPSQSRRRKPSRGQSGGTPGLNPRNSIGDGNEADLSGAGDTMEEPEEISTSRDDSDDKPRSKAPPPPIRAPSTHAPPPAREADVGEEEGATEEEEEAQESEDEEEDDIDPEVRRKEELRARMAKIGGGMGMYGMFGGPAIPSAPPKKKSTGNEQQVPADREETATSNTSAPPVPAMVALPGMGVRSPDEMSKQLQHDEESDDDAPVTSVRPANVIPDVEDVVPASEKETPPQVPTHASHAAPPVPSNRSLPPVVTSESRPPPPPPPAAQPPSPGPGSESDDELSERPQTSITSPIETPKPPPRNDTLSSPKSPSSKRASYFATDSFSPTSPTSNADKRTSRLPPPIPGAPHADQPQTRAPPPPPPDANVSRASTGDEPVHSSTKNVPQQESEGEITEYEGDYDTDIASAAPHKDALKAHTKEPQSDDTPLVRSPVLSPNSAPPPLPTAPRAVPPPLPSQPPPQPTRQSSEMPRAAPPPPPPVRMPSSREHEDDGEYDPYRYNAPRLGLSTSAVQSPSKQTNNDDDDLYEASPQRERSVLPPLSQERSVPPPPPQERAAPPPPPREQAAPQSRAPPRQSVDVHRPSGPGRRSVELSRMSMDSGFVANDVDLAENSAWWTKPNGIPPVFQGRKDILYEFDESTSNKRGGKTLVTKDLYVLFQDYSQTVITVQFDPQDPQDAKLEQRHEQPPPRLRQDQLEQAHEQYGKGIYDAVISKKDTVVGDGSPAGLVLDLLKPFSNALLPVGTRAYGAVVYANLANASTTQNDEIRPGDIITLRNAKFQGKHGPMHAKYSVDVGKPDHVGVVAEWDGTKKKVRAWEQGRESKKNKLESFKLDDLRSGEVKIWRVMPRSWVGWQGQN